MDKVKKKKIEYINMELAIILKLLYYSYYVVIFQNFR